MLFRSSARPLEVSTSTAIVASGVVAPSLDSISPTLELSGAVSSALAAAARKGILGELTSELIGAQQRAMLNTVVGREDRALSSELAAFVSGTERLSDPAAQTLLEKIAEGVRGGQSCR